MSTLFDKNKTFETYVVDKSNRFAVCACRETTEQLGIFNPLFIYGNAGTGKTHLLNATGICIKENFPDKNILFITAHQLSMNMVDFAKNDDMQKLRDKIDMVDVLIIDDIQYISGKPATQDCFFDVFNQLYAKKKQIIISSNIPPNHIPDLQERLYCRFVLGLVAQIEDHTPELKAKLLKD